MLREVVTAAAMIGLLSTANAQNTPRGPIPDTLKAPPGEKLVLQVKVY